MAGANPYDNTLLRSYSRERAREMAQRYRMMYDRADDKVLQERARLGFLDQAPSQGGNASQGGTGNALVGALSPVAKQAGSLLGKVVTGLFGGGGGGATNFASAFTRPSSVADNASRFYGGS